ncbi:MAG: AMIN domain-containing protein [Hydrogenimonas sp.]|nr:AMIN domain-containing protein [Hydrogenimonas sp.]
MRLTILITTFLVCTLYGRENPFKPVIDNTVLPVASNEIKKPPPFSFAKVKLPSDARVLTSVAIYYQSIDGSIKKEVIAIDRSIDWHKPIVISQRFVESAKKGAKEKKRRSSAAPKKAQAQKVFAPLPFLKLEVGRKWVKILTKDKKIRSFHLTKPFKVAVDFRRKAGFLTKHIPLDLPPFRSIDIGNHNGYYRVVITMDAPYRYKIVKAEDGYIVKLP